MKPSPPQHLLTTATEAASVDDYDDDNNNDFMEQHDLTTTTSARNLDNFLEDAYNYKDDNPHSSSSYSPCCNNDMIWNNNKWRYWLIMFSLGVANSSDASEILCLSYILSDSNFEDTMLRDTPWRAGLLAAAVFLGMLLGGLLVGTLGDFMGRRPMLLVGLVFNAVAGILSALAVNVWQLSAIRMMAGLGIGATVPPLFTLITELAPPTRRGFFVTFCASFWMVGSIYVAVSALALLQWYKTSWRIFAVACAVPSAAGAILVALLVPESPRFLALTGRHVEAVRVANDLARTLNYGASAAPPLTLAEALNQFPLRVVSTTTSNDGLTIITAASSSTSPATLLATRSFSLPWFCHVMKLAMADFLQSTSTLYTPQLRSTTWPLQLVWFTLNFGTYGILTWIKTLFKAVHLENIYYNALLFALANLPGNILSATLMDRTGRSPMLVGSSLAAAASLLSFAFFASAAQTTASSSSTTTDTPSLHLGINGTNTMTGNMYRRLLESFSQEQQDSSSSSSSQSISTFGIVLSACAFQCFSIAAWNTIDCMTSELFPTPVRSTGMGVCAASGRVGAMVAQFVNGALVSNPVRLLLVASSSLVLGAMTPCLLPAGGDLTGQPVQDTLTEGVVEQSTTRRGSSSSSRGSIHRLLRRGPGGTMDNGLSMEAFDSERDSGSMTAAAAATNHSAATPYMRVKNTPPPLSSYQLQQSK